MKMWDGRFEKNTAALMERFNNSLPFDQALIEEDIAGSLAWAAALAKARIISASEAGSIRRGLTAILKKHRAGGLSFAANDEDVHMAVERLLTARIGGAGARLHTGRSRNDQVATDVRLFVMKKLRAIGQRIVALQASLVRRAELDLDIIAPAYTHLQQAQPILLSHYWLSFFFLLEREKGRIDHAVSTADCMPLGSGAVAGSGFKLDRAALAKELGFSTISDNSIDGVASRDFAFEALAALASLGISLSRYAEDLIVWSSKEFSFVELDDAWSTGSSMMPQKKNPDSLELIRGKSGRFIGNQMRFAATLKGLGLAYFKDLQEDKEPLFDSLAHMDMALGVFADVIKSLQVHRKAIAADLDPLLLATDLADYLVKKGIPFRQAHKVVGAIVKHSINTGRALGEIPLATFKQFSPAFGPDVKKVFSWEQAIAHRSIAGGTGRPSVLAQIKKARGLLGSR